MGAIIAVPGSSVATTSDIKGKYLLKVPQNTKSLRFSFLGMKAITENIEGRTVVNVTLQEVENSLDQVVVVGYGQSRKKDLTGSVFSVQSNDMQGQIMTSIEQGLQGKVSGVNINQSDASPGGGLNITIRGSNSLIGGTEPLYVVDGFPIDGQSTEVKDAVSEGNQAQNKLNFLNPADIASIEILKDASSTAIYGSRGANGVVLITTKSGQNQKAEITVNHAFEMGYLMTTPPALSAYDFTWQQNMRKIVNDVYFGGKTYEATIAALPYQTTWNDNGSLVKGSPEDYANGLIASTDWIDVITRTGYSQKTMLSAKGGTENYKYYLSGGYDKVQGIIEATDFQRFSFSSNMNLNLNKRLSLNNTINLSYTTGKVGQSGLLNGDQKSLLMQAGIGTSPLSLIQDQYWDEEFGVLKGSDSPYVQATQFKELNTNQSLIERLSLNYKILKSLVFNVSGGVNYRNNIKDMYYPKSTMRGEKTGGGRAFYGTNASYVLLNDYMLTFKKEINKHTVALTGVYSLEYSGARRYSSAVSGFLNDVVENYNFDSATDYYKPTSYQSSALFSSFIGRLNYNYDERYLLTASIRADGSSKFGANNKWGYFPSAGFAWRLIEEDFFKPVPWFSDLKLRASYGITGNAGLGSYQSIPLMEVTRVAFNNTSYLGYSNSNIPNPNLKWEKTYQTNFGVDIGLFDNRFYATADVYDKTTHDLLQNLRLAPSAGFDTRIMNL
ncbi:MAG: SusC/RagA family TonB-linked outer membrane protein, partial [Bacteroidales bacterium]|nr:SusC/RagA family TonB-linked outer membrane protein [Bacteroidales bacterium]